MSTIKSDLTENISNDTLIKAREHALVAPIFHNDTNGELYIIDFKIDSTWFSSKSIENDFSRMTLVAF